MCCVDTLGYDVRLWLRLLIDNWFDAGVYLKVMQTHLVVLCSIAGRNLVCCIVRTGIYIFSSLIVWY